MNKSANVIGAMILLSSSLFSQEYLKNAKPFPFKAQPQSDSIISDAYMNHPITENDRITVGKDGHLYANGKRIRIFGTNLSDLPAVEDAEFWAQTLAAQGFNCVRFHHTDANWTNCFIKTDSNYRGHLNPETFKRFDKLVYELKKNGIYSNINLLTGRTYYEHDGLPKEIEQVKDWKDRHCFGFWDERGRKVQKDYASWLLNHKNEYTGLTYAQDPAISFVEINNEN